MALTDIFITGRLNSMRPRVILSKARGIFRYLKTSRRRRLYQQWVERSQLPPETVPREEFAEDIIPKIDKKQLRLPMLYMLLGASLMMLCVGLVLVIVHSC